ncbi:MAG: peptide-methionine (S)-S-oxide reductase MsrA [Flavobacteriales bacterium]|nr:peptide-methionine (S)-S-oxide reductase MsrA [Flavobacteriales bacterium]
MRSLMLLCSILGCTLSDSIENANQMTPTSMIESDSAKATATFGAGCFWCVEAMFESLRGVKSAVSGYSGGHVANPTYKEVCNGTTGHAEVIQVRFSPDEISYEELLEAFFLSHDPTQIDRQGADVGTQYRSVIFFHSPEQEQLAKSYKDRLNATGAFSSPVVTEIAAFNIFYEAEDYHQEYFAVNPNQPYCSAVVGPKLEKFRKVFKEKLK